MLCAAWCLELLLVFWLHLGGMQGAQGERCAVHMHGAPPTEPHVTTTWRAHAPGHLSIAPPCGGAGREAGSRAVLVLIKTKASQVKPHMWVLSAWNQESPGSWGRLVRLRLEAGSWKRGKQAKCPPPPPPTSSHPPGHPPPPPPPSALRSPLSALRSPAPALLARGSGSRECQLPAPHPLAPTSPSPASLYDSQLRALAPAPRACAFCLFYFFLIQNTQYPHTSKLGIAGTCHNSKCGNAAGQVVGARTWAWGPPSGKPRCMVHGRAGGLIWPHGRAHGAAWGRSGAAWGCMGLHGAAWGRMGRMGRIGTNPQGPWAWASAPQIQIQ
jgi:hypothetical protein